MAVRAMVLMFVLIAGTTTASADITVIDFSDLRPNEDFPILGYTKDAFSLSTQDWFWLTSPETSLGNLWAYQDENYFYMGKTALEAAYVHYDVPTITLTYGKGAVPFDMLSIDLAPESTVGKYPPIIKFVGNHPDGTQTIDSVTVTNWSGFQTFDLPGMANVLSVSWVNGPYRTQFTDIAVEPTPNIQSVPELSSFNMTAAAVAMIAVAAMKRRYQS